jgi:hypothetical protein
MISSIEAIPSIASRAAGKTPGGELIFTFPEVLEVVKLCSANEIAVLGVEIFRVTASGYSASGSSDYDLQLTRKWLTVRPTDWRQYVSEANELAEKTVSRNPVGDEHVYVLTAASWSEFSTIQP